jgi:hypothetical protein
LLRKLMMVFEEKEGKPEQRPPSPQPERAQ